MFLGFPSETYKALMISNLATYDDWLREADADIQLAAAMKFTIQDDAIHTKVAGDVLRGCHLSRLR